MPVSFKADWVIYTAVIYLWMKNTADDKLVRKKIQRQNLFNVQALSPVMAKCRAQDRGAPLVPHPIPGRGNLPRQARSHLQPTFFLLNPVSGKQSEKRIRIP